MDFNVADSMRRDIKVLVTNTRYAVYFTYKMRTWDLSDIYVQAQEPQGVGISKHSI